MMKLIARRTLLAAALSLPAFGALAAPLVMGFSQVGAESEWRTANSASIKSAAKEAGITLKFADAQQKQENQVKAIRSFIAQKVDVIAFSPVVESGWDTVLKEAKNAGIPVILTDRAVKVADTSLYVTFIGSDFVEEGRKAAKLAAGACGQDAGRRAEHRRAAGHRGLGARHRPQEGLRGGHQGQPEAADHPLAVRRVHARQGQGGDGVLPEAARQEDRRAVRAQRRHGDRRDPGDRGSRAEAGVDIVIISIDGVRGAFEAMKAGKLNVTVECNPLLGPQLMQLAKDVVGEEAGREADHGQ